MSALCRLPIGNGCEGWLSTGRQHDVVDRHGQREAAGETHADGTDARPAAALVFRRGQGTQPAW